MVWQAGLLDSLGEESRQHKREKSVQGKVNKGVWGDKNKDNYVTTCIFPDVYSLLNGNLRRWNLFYNLAQQVPDTVS